MKLKYLGITMLSLLILAGYFFVFPYNSEKINIPLSMKHRGVCWVGGPREVFARDLEALATKNVNWISQTPFGWQQGHDNPAISSHTKNPSTQDGWWGERDEGLRITTEFAKSNRIKTILKPHIWLRDEGGKWRGEIKMKSEKDWQKWFSDYEDFIMHYAKLAEETQMEMLCIGTELHQTCIEREDDWRNLIAKIRTAYSGPLTYAANFSNEYEDVKFWDDLDYIGIQAYFPLVMNEEPSVEELKEGWKKPIEELKAFSHRYNKPILFTEVGYKSTKDSGITPWEWPQRLAEAERAEIVSEQTQANCFEALFLAVMDEPWLAGIHIWKWYPNYGNNTNRRNSLMENIDFTPQLKMAEKVVVDGFLKMKNSNDVL
ncbi:MAG: hypothetical protein ACJAS3_000049 [Roseivirga sp.]|jgi:hypothetical protein